MIRRISTSLALASILIHILWAGMGEVVCVDALPVTDDAACAHACCDTIPPASPSTRPHDDCCVTCPGNHWCRADAPQRERLLPGAFIAVLHADVAAAPVAAGATRAWRPAALRPPPGTAPLRSIVLQV
jgi:hypothetical protein